MSRIPERSARFMAAFRERILVLDGAMGTMIQARDLSAEDFGGDALEGCNENLNLTRPDVIRGIHQAYLDAGADLISTNSFGCAPYVLTEYGLSDKCEEICRAAGRIAREAADAGSTPARPRFVIGAMGPGTRTITVTGGVTFDEGREGYRAQDRGLIAGGGPVGGGGGGLPGPGPRPDRGRCGRAPPRDQPGHAERQGRRHGSARGFGGGRPRPAPDGQRNRRADGHHAGGP